MKKYRTFEIVNDLDKLHGIIQFRLDDEDKTIFKKLREVGFDINRRKNALIWWNDDYVEIINKKTETSIGYLELCYR